MEPALLKWEHKFELDDVDLGPLRLLSASKDDENCWPWQRISYDCCQLSSYFLILLYQCLQQVRLTWGSLSVGALVKASGERSCSDGISFVFSGPCVDSVLSTTTMCCLKKTATRVIKPRSLKMFWTSTWLMTPAFNQQLKIRLSVWNSAPRRMTSAIVFSTNEEKELLLPLAAAQYHVTKTSQTVSSRDHL